MIGGNLSSYDYVLIPGGNGIADLMNNRRFPDWITVRGDRPVVAAVCGGALLAGATGILHGRRATTHPNLQPVLTRFAREVTGERIVDEGSVITAGGVTAAIDLGLYLCEKIAGRGIRGRIQVQMDYPYYPFP